MSGRVMRFSSAESDRRAWYVKAEPAAAITRRVDDDIFVSTA
jgi:hypothetical protein